MGSSVNDLFVFESDYLGPQKNPDPENRKAFGTYRLQNLSIILRQLFYRHWLWYGIVLAYTALCRRLFPVQIRV